jgi:hypothetical protein
VLLWYKKPPSKYTREGSYPCIFLFFPRAARAARARALKIRQTNSAILKVRDGALIR